MSELNHKKREDESHRYEFPTVDRDQDRQWHAQNILGAMAGGGLFAFGAYKAFPIWRALMKGEDIPDTDFKIDAAALYNKPTEMKLSIDNFDKSVRDNIRQVQKKKLKRLKFQQRARGNIERELISKFGSLLVNQVKDEVYRDYILKTHQFNKPLSYFDLGQGARDELDNTEAFNRQLRTKLHRLKRTLEIASTEEEFKGISIKDVLKNISETKDTENNKVYNKIKMLYEEGQTYNPKTRKYTTYAHKMPGGPARLTPLKITDPIREFQFKIALNRLTPALRDEAAVMLNLSDGSEIEKSLQNKSISYDEVDNVLQELLMFGRYGERKGTKRKFMVGLPKHGARYYGPLVSTRNIMAEARFYPMGKDFKLSTNKSKHIKNLYKYVDIRLGPGSGEEFDRWLFDPTNEKASASYEDYLKWVNSRTEDMSLPHQKFFGYIGGEKLTKKITSAHPDLDLGRLHKKTFNRWVENLLHAESRQQSQGLKVDFDETSIVYKKLNAWYNKFKPGQETPKTYILSSAADLLISGGTINDKVKSAVEISLRDIAQSMGMDGSPRDALYVADILGLNKDNLYQDFQHKILGPGYGHAPVLTRMFGYGPTIHSVKGHYINPHVLGLEIVANDRITVKGVEKTVRKNQFFEVDVVQGGKYKTLPSGSLGVFKDIIYHPLETPMGVGLDSNKFKNLHKFTFQQSLEAIDGMFANRILRTITETLYRTGVDAKTESFKLMSAYNRRKQDLYKTLEVISPYPLDHYITKQGIEFSPSLYNRSQKFVDYNMQSKLGIHKIYSAIEQKKEIQKGLFASDFGKFITLDTESIGEDLESIKGKLTTNSSIFQIGYVTWDGGKPLGDISRAFAETSTIAKSTDIGNRKVVQFFVNPIPYLQEVLYPEVVKKAVMDSKEPPSFNSWINDILDTHIKWHDEKLTDIDLRAGGVSPQAEFLRALKDTYNDSIQRGTGMWTTETPIARQVGVDASGKPIWSKTKHFALNILDGKIEKGKIVWDKNSRAFENIQSILSRSLLQNEFGKFKPIIGQNIQHDATLIDLSIFYPWWLKRKNQKVNQPIAKVIRNTMLVDNVKLGQIGMRRLPEFAHLHLKDNITVSADYIRQAYPEIATRMNKSFGAGGGAGEKLTAHGALKDSLDSFIFFNWLQQQGLMTDSLRDLNKITRQYVPAEEKLFELKDYYKEKLSTYHKLKIGSRNPLVDEPSSSFYMKKEDSVITADTIDKVRTEYADTFVPFFESVGDSNAIRSIASAWDITKALPWSGLADVARQPYQFWSTSPAGIGQSTTNAARQKWFKDRSEAYFRAGVFKTKGDRILERLTEDKNILYIPVLFTNDYRFQEGAFFLHEGMAGTNVSEDLGIYIRRDKTISVIDKIHRPDTILNSRFSELMNKQWFKNLQPDFKIGDLTLDQQDALRLTDKTLLARSLSGGDVIANITGDKAYLRSIRYEEGKWYFNIEQQFKPGIGTKLIAPGQRYIVTGTFGAKAAEARGSIWDPVKGDWIRDKSGNVINVRREIYGIAGGDFKSRMSIGSLMTIITGDLNYQINVALKNKKYGMAFKQRLIEEGGLEEMLDIINMGATKPKRYIKKDYNPATGKVYLWADEQTLTKAEGMIHGRDAFTTDALGKARKKYQQLLLDIIPDNILKNPEALKQEGLADLFMLGKDSTGGAILDKFGSRLAGTVLMTPISFNFQDPTEAVFAMKDAVRNLHGVTAKGFTMSPEIMSHAMMKDQRAFVSKVMAELAVEQSWKMKHATVWNMLARTPAQVALDDLINIAEEHGGLKKSIGMHELPIIAFDDEQVKRLRKAGFKAFSMEPELAALENTEELNRYLSEDGGLLSTRLYKVDLGAESIFTRNKEEAARLLLSYGIVEDLIEGFDRADEFAELVGQSDLVHAKDLAKSKLLFNPKLRQAIREKGLLGIEDIPAGATHPAEVISLQLRHKVTVSSGARKGEVIKYLPLPSTYIQDLYNLDQANSISQKTQLLKDLHQVMKLNRIDNLSRGEHEQLQIVVTRMLNSYQARTTGKFGTMRRHMNQMFLGTSMQGQVLARPFITPEVKEESTGRIRKGTFLHDTIIQNKRAQAEYGAILAHQANRISTSIRQQIRNFKMIPPAFGSVGISAEYLRDVGFSESQIQELMETGMIKGEPLMAYVVREPAMAGDWAFQPMRVMYDPRGTYGRSKRGFTFDRIWTKLMLADYDYDLVKIHIPGNPLVSSGTEKFLGVGSAEQKQAYDAWQRSMSEKFGEARYLINQFNKKHELKFHKGHLELELKKVPIKGAFGQKATKEEWRVFTKYHPDNPLPINQFEMITEFNKAMESMSEGRDYKMSATIRDMTEDAQRVIMSSELKMTPGEILDMYKKILDMWGQPLDKDLNTATDKMIDTYVRMAAAAWGRKAITPEIVNIARQWGALASKYFLSERSGMTMREGQRAAIDLSRFGFTMSQLAIESKKVAEKMGKGIMSPIVLGTAITKAMKEPTAPESIELFKYIFKSGAAPHPAILIRELGGERKALDLKELQKQLWDFVESNKPLYSRMMEAKKFVEGESGIIGLYKQLAKMRKQTVLGQEGRQGYMYSPTTATTLQMSEMFSDAVIAQQNLYGPDKLNQILIGAPSSFKVAGMKGNKPDELLTKLMNNAKIIQETNVSISKEYRMLKAGEYFSDIAKQLKSKEEDIGETIAGHTPAFLRRFQTAFSKSALSNAAMLAGFAIYRMMQPEPADLGPIPGKGGEYFEHNNRLRNLKQAWSNDYPSQTLDYNNTARVQMENVLRGQQQNVQDYINDVDEDMVNLRLQSNPMIMPSFGSVSGSRVISTKSFFQYQNIINKITDIMSF